MRAEGLAVAIQGEAGSFSDQAARQVHGGDVRLLPCLGFAELFRAVETGAADRGMVPIENSLAGSIHENYDLLGARALHVVAETELRIRHCLIAPPDIALADVRRVVSHPVALAQCRRFFTEHPELEPVPAYDTAGSVRDLMARRVAGTAAIASAFAAALYGAVVLCEGLEDHAENYTRFLVVAREPAPLERVTKTSLVLTLPNLPGSLYRALGSFAERRLQLTKLESRPIAGRPWEYSFYLDVIGDPRAEVGEALAELSGLTRELRVLGSYPGAEVAAAP